MKTPDITPAQVLAFIAFIVAQCVAFGWIDGTAQQSILSAVGTALPVAWALADAMIRRGRANVAAAQVHADAALALNGIASAPQQETPAA
jgi:hypothetical protein